MSLAEISDADIQAVYPMVATTIADALGLDAEDVELKHSLIEDLEAESIDFLDLVFRLERAFKIKIPRGRILEDARGEMAESEFEANGTVTETGLARLREFLSEVPAARFTPGLKTADIPRLYTAETFCKLVVRAQRDAAAAG